MSKAPLPPDTTVRRMRTVAGAVFLGLIAFMVIFDRADPVIIGTLVGALLVDLGFEVGMRLPYFTGDTKGDTKDEKGDNG